MLRKFILISVFALCATFYAYGPEWSSVSAQTIPDAQPIPEDFGDDFTGVTDPDVPATSDDLEFSPTGGDGAGFTNTSDGPLDDVILTTPLGEGQGLPSGSDWTEITLPDGTRVAAYNAGTLDPGESVEVPVTIEGIAGGSLLPARLDGTDGDGNTISLAGTISSTPQSEMPVSLPLPDDFAEALPATTGETFTVPEEDQTTDLVFSPADGSEGSVVTIPATVSDGIVTLPVGFTNSSADTLDNVILTVPLGEGETLPEDSEWTEVTLPDGNRVAAFNLGSLAANDSTEIPFIFNSNNVAAGDPIQLQTRLDATNSDGDAIVITGTVDQRPLSPTALSETDEPVQNIRLFLPIISR